MSNPHKNNKVYDEFVRDLEQISHGKSPSENFGKLVDKAYHSFTNGFKPQTLPANSYAEQVIKDLSEYATLLDGRKTIDVAGGKRDITTETETYQSLKNARNLVLNLILPKMDEKNYLSNRMFREISDLSLSCLESVVNGVAQEYIDREKAADVKILAVDLARKGRKISDFYSNKGFSYNLANLFRDFNTAFEAFPSQYLRSFETVAVAPKDMSRKKECIEEIKKKVLAKNEKEQLLYAPSLICPVAQGGNELGIILANAFEEEGHQVSVYPLMYSIKTRKQRYPWIAHDGEFLAEHIKEKDILLTEDWVTTGNTVRGILKELEGAFPHEIRIATIKRDPEQSRAPLLEKYGFYVGAWNKYVGTKNDSINDLKTF